MKLDKINYESLKFTDGFSSTKVSVPKVILTSLAGVIIVIGLAILTRGNIFIFIQFGVMIFCFSLVFYWRKILKKRNEAWRRFADDNNWSIASEQPITAEYVPPSLLDVGRAHKLGDIVHAEIDGHTCNVYMYQFTTGRGKGRRTHYYTIAQILLPKSFPHLILDSRSALTTHQRGNADTRVRLEGNFDKFFRLYHVEDEHIDALSIITPDVMQTLINANAAQDIEIVGQNVYFMAASDHRNFNQLPKLFASVDALSDELKHKAKTLRYDGANL